MMTLVKVQASSAAESVAAFELVRQRGLFETFLLICAKLNIELSDPLAEKIAKSLVIAADAGSRGGSHYLDLSRRIAAKRFIVLWLWLTLSVVAGALIGLISLR
jgi:hypothetical protein